MISVQGIGLFLGKKQLFHDVSFHVGPRDRIGLVGANGTGKTSLFLILSGRRRPDEGLVTRGKHVRIGYLPQQWEPSGDKTVLDHTMDVHGEVREIRRNLEFLEAEMRNEKERDRIRRLAISQTRLLEKLEHLGGYDLESRAEKVLAGLGFDGSMSRLPLSSLSGGWMMRVELARLLLSEPDLLLLDEPTNHLDLDSLLWLENYLANTKSAVMVIAHDRVFLNRVVGRIFELEGGRLEKYEGSYDEFVREKAKRREIRLAEYRCHQERVRQIRRFIDRNRSRKDRARQVQSRMRMLEKMEKVDAPKEEKAVAFQFPEIPRSGKRVFEIRGLRKRFGSTVVYDGVDLVVERGDRVALLGPNGAGKTTLLKILAGIVDPDEGRLRWGHQVRIGYYAQNLWDQLHPEWTVLQEVLSVCGDMGHVSVRGLLGTFRFRGDDVEKRVGVLSGGEKARLTLCKLIVQAPNVLLLDEPTNHLDIPSREVLERALDAFGGTICFVSHDRHFIDRLATKILVVRSHRLDLLPGNWKDYERIWRRCLKTSEDEMGGGDGWTKDDRCTQPRVKNRDKERKRLEARWRNELYRLKRPYQQRLQELEKELEKEQLRLEEIGKKLASPDTYVNNEDVPSLHRAHERCRQRIEELTRLWETDALELEELEKRFWEEKDRWMDDQQGEMGSPRPSR